MCMMKLRKTKPCKAMQSHVNIGVIVYTIEMKTLSHISYKELIKPKSSNGPHL